MDTTPPAELPVAEILARGVVVEWFEAVALVRAVTELLTRGSDSRRTPDLGQIQLKRDGFVRMTGTSYADEPVRRLGQLLQALVSRSDPPTTLRLVIANAIAPTPIYADLAHFDRAAAYFERPDRPAVLRALLARAERQIVPGTGTPVQSVDRVAPLPEGTEDDHGTTSRTVRQMMALAIVGGLVFAAAFLAARVYREQHLPAGVVADAAHRATGSLEGAMRSGLSAVTERIGLGRLAAPAPKPVAVAPAPPVPATVGAPQARPRRRSATEPGTIQAFDLEPATSVPESTPVAPAVTIRSAKGAPPARSRDVSETDGTVLYSEGSPGIVPPTAVRPKFPKNLPPGVDPLDLSRIEVTIQQDGSVESVKLIPGLAYSVKGIMLLSAAKAWHFSPATKDGVPVRYRKTIWIIAE